MPQKLRYVPQDTVGIPEIGSAIMFTGNNLPSGVWNFCRGQEVNRFDFQKLFAAIGILHGAGDGSTTFNLPNFTYRVPIGAGISPLKTYSLGEKGGEEAHILTPEEMTVHKHQGVAATGGYHNHPLYDSGHNHAIADPGHSHYAMGFPRGNTEGSGQGYTCMDPTTNRSNWERGNPANGKLTSQQTTGVTISGATAGVSIGATGDHTHTIQIDNQGGGRPFNVLQPYLVVEFIIRML